MMRAPANRAPVMRLTHALRIAASLVIAAAFACDGRGNVTGPDSNVTGPNSGDESSRNPFPGAVLTISGAPSSGGQLTEGDTITLTARVVDAAGVELLSPVIQWEGGGLVRTGARSAALIVRAGDNNIKAVATVGAVTVASSTTVISALPNPGEMVLWNAGTGEISRIKPPATAWKIVPVAINDRDEVTGTLSYAGNSKRAFFWSRETGFVEIPSPLYVDVNPAAINNDGLIAGTLDRDLGESLNMFLWSRSSGFSLIPDRGAYAVAINDSGRVVGSKDGAPFVWSAGGGFALFSGAGNAPFSGQAGYTSSGVAISDDNAVLASWTGKYQRGVDYSWLWDSFPTVWMDGVRKDLECNDCIVSDMNNSHTVTGIRWSRRVPFRWTPGEGIEALPLDGKVRPEVVAINDGGVVVGAVASGAAPLRAAAWLASGLVVMPELSGTRTSEAKDVNSLGHVLAGAW